MMKDSSTNTSIFALNIKLCYFFIADNFLKCIINAIKIEIVEVLFCFCYKTSLVYVYN